jgi:hypothetical protein
MARRKSEPAAVVDADPVVAALPVVESDIGGGGDPLPVVAEDPVMFHIGTVSIGPVVAEEPVTVYLQELHAAGEVMAMAIGPVDEPPPSLADLCARAKWVGNEACIPCQPQGAALDEALDALGYVHARSSQVAGLTIISRR